jgi:ATP-dependent Clp protease ATP-binding subunit ClpC
MFNFQIEKSRLYSLILAEKYFLNIKIQRKLFLVLVLLFLFLIILDLLFSFFSENFFQRIFGFFILFSTLLIAFFLQELFFYQQIKESAPRIPLAVALENFQQYNLADFFDIEAAKALLSAQNLAKINRQPLNATLLFYCLLPFETSKFVFSRLNFSFEVLNEKLINFLQLYQRKFSPKESFFSEDFQETILESLKRAFQKEKKIADAGDLLEALSQKEPFLKRFLIEKELKAEDLINLVRLKERLEKEKERKRKFWEMEQLSLLTPLGKDLAFGFTITLDKYSRDFTKESLGEFFFKMVDHEREAKELEHALSGVTLSNVMLVGKPGSGRKKIVKNFALKSFLGQTFPVLNYQRVIGLNLPLLFAQTPNLEEAEAELERIFKEVVLAGNVVLVIEDFHNYVASSRKPGVLNIAGILGPYLQNPFFRLIVLTDYEGYHSEIEKNPSLINFFTKIEVAELDAPQSLRVLEDWSILYESKSRKLIPYQVLRQIVSHSINYLPDLPALPKRAIDLLDDVVSYSMAQSQLPFVSVPEVDAVVTAKTEIPVGKLEAKEKETLLNLETLFHKRIVNQEEAVKELAEALRRARAGIKVRKGPIGAFLFLGSTGVGKTETAKALAEIYFGAENRMVRLDMSEFQQEKDIERLIGSKTQDGLLVNQIRDNPFTLLLLDEVEKAHPNILNLFLQVLDEGFLTDGRGQKVSFKNSIIIGTSNAGSDFLWKQIDIKKNELIFHLIDKNIFKPEFLNRFDAVILFRPLTRNNLLEIVDLILAGLKKDLKEKEISLSVSPQVKEAIVDLGYNPSFGARELRRVIQEKIGNPLAMAILEGKIQRGDSARFELKGKADFEIVVDKFQFSF